MNARIWRQDAGETRGAVTEMKQSVHLQRAYGPRGEVERLGCEKVSRAIDERA